MNRFGFWLVVLLLSVSALALGLIMLVNTILNHPLVK